MSLQYSPISSDLKQDMDAWCRSAYASIEAAVYENTLKSGKVIDKKLTELFEALGRISKLFLSIL